MVLPEHQLVPIPYVLEIKVCSMAGKVISH